MKLAILSESPADDAAVRILVEAVLGAATEPVSPKSLRRRSGFNSISPILPVILKELHYHTDTEALIVVVDGNGSAMHQETHGESPARFGDCRLCRLRQRFAEVTAALPPRTHAPPLRMAVGVAYPAIEAWYRCGIDPHATEAAWARDLAVGVKAPQAIHRLKQAVYGTPQPSLDLETDCAVREARRLAANMAPFEVSFPAGFGALARDVRGWLG